MSSTVYSCLDPGRCAAPYARGAGRAISHSSSEDSDDESGSDATAIHRKMRERGAGPCRRWRMRTSPAMHPQGVTT